MTRRAVACTDILTVNFECSYNQYIQLSLVICELTSVFAAGIHHFHVSGDYTFSYRGIDNDDHLL